MTKFTVASVARLRQFRSLTGVGMGTFYRMAMRLLSRWNKRVV